MAIIEQAFKTDPRIKKFKEEEKYAKEAKKREKEAATRAAEEEAKRVGSCASMLLLRH